MDFRVSVRLGAFMNCHVAQGMKRAACLKGDILRVFRS